jgi:hypothetical protein
MILGTPVGREYCIAEHKQAVRHHVLQSGFSELDQLVKIFIVFSQILWLITVILILYIDQIIFIPLSHKHHFCNVHFNIILKLFTRISAAPFLHTNISGTYFFCTNPQLSIYILN